MSVVSIDNVECNRHCYYDEQKEVASFNSSFANWVCHRNLHEVFNFSMNKNSFILLSVKRNISSDENVAWCERETQDFSDTCYVHMSSILFPSCDC